MKKFLLSKSITIALTIFVLFAVIGFAYPLFAYSVNTTFPGTTLSNKLVPPNITTFKNAIADANFIEGGHMQVPTHGALLGFPSYPGSDLASSTSIVYVTAQRRRVGMMVTVLDDTLTGTTTYTSTIGSHTVTYRLVANPIGGAGCPTSTGSVTDQSLDGSAAACDYTQDSDWTVVIPYLDPTLAGTVQFLGTNGNGAVSLYPAPSGRGSSTTLILSPSGSGSA